MTEDIEEKTQAEELEEEEELKNQEIEGEDESIQKEKLKKPKKDRIGILYIYTTKNNTILSVTDLAGNTLARSSGGQSTKQSRLKSSPTVAMFSAKRIAEEVKEKGITSFYVRVKARTGSISPGSSSHSIVKSLTRDGFKIINIMEITKQPRGGPKPKGGRRGRRV